MSSASQGPSVNPVLANILFRATGSETSNPPVSASISNGQTSSNPSQQDIARVAVGRGIRHSFSHPSARKPAPLPPRPVPSAQSGPTGRTVAEPSDSVVPVVQASLSALKSNFQNSLDAALGQAANSTEKSDDTTFLTSYVPGSLRRDDSLVDLAMIPLVDEGNYEADLFSSTGGLSSTAGFSFIDFPWQDPNPPTNG